MDMKTQKMLADIIVNAKKDEVKPYTTKATVRSVNGTTIYVDIPGSDNSTPIKASSVAVKAGDIVDLYVSHNDTHITGNRSDVAVSQSTADKMSKDAEQSKLEMYNDLEIIGNKMKIMNNDITMQGNQIDMQNNTITQMNDTIYSQGNAITQQDNKITEIGNTVNSQGNTITQQGNKITEMNSTIETLDSTVQTQASKVSTLESTVQTQGSDIETINSDIETLNSTVQTQGSTIETLNSTVETQGSTIETLNSTVQTQGSKISTLDSTVQTQGSTIENLNSTVQTQGSTIETLNSTVQTQSSSIEVLDSSMKIVNSAFIIQNGKMTGISEILTNILNSDYVTTDLLNADVAWIENGKIKQGAIGTVEIADAAITTQKVKDLSADVIKTGTLKTECLILTTDEVDPETGEKKVALITALNAKTKAGEGDVLDGAIIKDETIEAAKIKVVDLEAFGATIGNFEIETSNIHNGKTSLTDPTNGIYIGTDGIALGQGSLLSITDDSPFRVESNGDFHLGGKDNNYINFDAFNGKLEIDADSIKMGSSSLASQSYVDQKAEGITTTVTDVNDRLTTMEQNSEGFTWSIDKTAIVSSVNEYYQSTSATTLTGGSWSENAPTWTQGTYIWIRIKNTNGKGTVTYSKPVCVTGNTGAQGTKGDKGDQGPQGEKGDQGIQGPKGDTGDTGPQGEKGDTGAAGSTTYFHIKYSSVANPTSSSQMTETPSEYIGTYVDFTPTDSSEPSKYTWSRFQGIQGDKGDQGIPGTNGSNGKTSYLHIKYSNDGGSTFTANSGETVGTYIGTCVDYNSADPTTVSSYTWAKIKGDTGATGADGRGISNTTVTYQAGSSGTTVPTGTWSTSVPSVSAGQYLWTKTVTTYTSGNPTTAYSVGRMGTNGQNGTNGTNGTDGKGIKSTAITYQAWSSGTTTPTGSWSTSVPNTTADKPYLWTKTVITYTDNTTSTSYSVGSTPEGIVVGGRNILLNSKFNSNADKWTVQGDIIDYVVKDGRKCAHINHSSLKCTKIVSQSIFGKLEPSTQYTMSGWVLTENLVKGTTNFTCMFYCDGSYLNNGTATWYGYGSKGFPINADEWTHLEWTFSTDSAKFATATTCNMFVHTRDLTGDIYFSDLKLEKGNKATDWTPAPEDIEQAIEDVEVGGQNLLSDTNIPSMTKKTGPANKYLSDSGNADYSTGEFVAVSNLPVPGFTHVFRFTCTTASSTETAGRSLCFYNGATVSMIDGQEYTMSMYARKTSGNGKIRFLVGYSKYPDYDNYIDVTSEWKRYSYTFTYSDSATGGSGGARAYFGASCAVVGVVETFGWKLERGNKATDWSLSIEAGKTATNYMNFSSDGLVVGDMTASTLGKNVLIDSDSVDIRNGTNVLASYGEDVVIYKGDAAAFTIKQADYMKYAIDIGRYFEITVNFQKVNMEWQLKSIETSGSPTTTLNLNPSYIYVIKAASDDAKNWIVFRPEDAIAQNVSSIKWYATSPNTLTVYANGIAISYPCNQITDTGDVDVIIKGGLRIINGSDICGTLDSGVPLYVGSDDGIHIEMDGNEITAKSNNKTPSHLYLNMDGGNVSVNNNCDRAIMFQDGAIYAKNRNASDTSLQNTWIGIIDGFNESGNTTLGYGGYLNGVGETNVYGKNVNLIGTTEIKADSKNSMLLKSTAGIELNTTSASGNSSSIKVNGTDITLSGAGNVTIGSQGNKVYMDGSNIIFDNAYGLSGKNASGNVRRNIQLVNGNNNFILGYDSYMAKEGSTNIYGNRMLLLSQSDLRSTRTLTKLWSGAYFVNANQTLSLSDKVSNQLNGIVLSWSFYSSGAKDYYWNHVFIPKGFVANHSGNGTSIILAGNPIGYKYVYITDQTIAGTATNESASTTISGITTSSNKYVLRYVWGV